MIDMFKQVMLKNVNTFTRGTRTLYVDLYVDYIEVLI